MLHRSLLVLVASVVVLGVLAAPAHAGRERYQCPPGQAFNTTLGACAKKAKAAPRSPQKKYEDAQADINGTIANADPNRGVRSLDEACRANYAPACTLLGFMYSRARVVKNDPVKGMELFVKACGMKDIDGCFQVGDLAERVGLYAEARQAFSHACDIGSGLGCLRAGDLYRGELGDTKAEPATATARYKAGYVIFQPLCPGDGTACYALGFLYENGYGVEKNPAGALTSYRTGCTGGSGVACLSLGNALAAGISGSADADGANEAYTTACETYDDADSCQKIAERLGMASKDLDHAFLLATRACLLDPKNCGTLGEFYRLGYGTTADQDVASNHYKNACDAGAATWCSTYSQRLHDGVGVGKDVAAGTQLAQKACVDGSNEGCRFAASFLVVNAPDKALEMAMKGCERSDGGSCYLAGSYAATVNKFDVALQLYERACDGDNAPGCAEAAKQLSSGKNVTADPAKAQELEQKACIANDATVSGEACEGLVRMFYFGTPKNAESAMYSAARACAAGRPDPCDWLGQLSSEVPGDHADLKEYLATACGNGNAGSCNAQATLLLRGTEAEKKTALGLLDASCAKGVDSACLAKADALYQGNGTLPQPEAAEKIYDEHCTKGAAGACTMMSIIANKRKDYEKAVAYAKRACDVGNADGCNNLGYFYFTAKGVRWDAAEGVKQWQKACELGSGYGCSNMGYMYRYGVVVPKDAKKALEAYTKSCTPTEQIGCQGAAHYFETGEGGTPVDAKKAADAYRTACETPGDPVALACTELASMLERTHQAGAPEVSRLREKGFGIAKDKAPNNPYTSWMLGTYYRDGIATAKDPAKAREWFAKACEEYDPLGCLDAGKAFLATGAPADAEVARSKYLERSCTVGLTEACDLKMHGGKGGTPGGNVKAKGCGCQSGGSDGGWLFALGVGALVLRRRARART